MAARTASRVTPKCGEGLWCHTETGFVENGVCRISKGYLRHQDFHQGGTTLRTTHNPDLHKMALTTPTLEPLSSPCSRFNHPEITRIHPNPPPDPPSFFGGLWFRPPSGVLIAPLCAPHSTHYIRRMWCTRARAREAPSTLREIRLRQNCGLARVRHFRHGPG